MAIIVLVTRSHTWASRNHSYMYGKKTLCLTWVPYSVIWVAKTPRFLLAGSEFPDKNDRMPKLMGVFFDCKV